MENLPHCLEGSCEKTHRTVRTALEHRYVWVNLIVAEKYSGIKRQWGKHSGFFVPIKIGPKHKMGLYLFSDNINFLLHILHIML